MTASRTLVKGTLLAIRSVLSSTAASSTECPSVNARSRDCVTSLLNSDSAALESEMESDWTCEGSELMDDAPDAPKPRRDPSSSSSSDDSDSDEVTDPASSNSRSEASSPIENYIFVIDITESIFSRQDSVKLSNLIEVNAGYYMRRSRLDLRRLRLVHLAKLSHSSPCRAEMLHTNLGLYMIVNVRSHEDDATQCRKENRLLRTSSRSESSDISSSSDDCVRCLL